MSKVSEVIAQVYESWGGPELQGIWQIGLDKNMWESEKCFPRKQQMDLYTMDIRMLEAQKPDESQDRHTEIIMVNPNLEGIH